MKNILIILGVSVLLILGMIFVVLPFIGTSGQNQEEGNITNDAQNDIEEPIVDENNDTVVEMKVNIQNYTYSPTTVTITVGDTVTWTNLDNVRHDVVSGTFNSTLLARGESFSHTFTQPGTYEYICTPHPYMKGTIIVEEIDI